MPPGSLADCRVLHVEDEPSDARLVREELEAAGACVQWAHNAAHARALAEVHSYDVALLDVVLPFESGLSLAQDLSGADKRLNVVFLTSLTHDRAWELANERAKTLGFRWVLHKTRDIARLASILAQACQSSAPAERPSNAGTEAQFESAIAEQWRERPGALQRRVCALAREFSLTNQQADVIEGLLMGLNDREIGELLGVSRYRIGQVLPTAFKKMGVQGRHGFVSLLALRGDR